MVTYYITMYRIAYFVFLVLISEKAYLCYLFATPRNEKEFPLVFCFSSREERRRNEVREKPLKEEKPSQQSFHT